jgi:predicted TIM-barrel enzyme
MVHLGALPGAPLHDADAGLDGIVEAARADLRALQAAGFDAVMFGNENDRPYEFDVDRASTATMAYVIGRLREEITVPFGVNVLWDPMSHDCTRRSDGCGLRARDLHRHLCLRHGAVDAGCREGHALPRPAGAGGSG